MGVLNTCFNNLSSIQSVSYNQRRAYKSAWDSFVWFAVMVMLSGFLVEFGTIKWIAIKIGSCLKSYPAMVAVPSLMMIYFFIHYLVLF